MSQEIISFNNFQMKINDEKYLEIPHLAINRGDIVFILGANGCGKSTLLTALSREGTPSAIQCSGEIILNNNGQSIDLTKGITDKEAPLYYRSISFLKQQDEFETHTDIKRAMRFPTLCVLEQLGVNVDRQYLNELTEQYYNEFYTKLDMDNGKEGVLKKFFKKFFNKKNSLSGGEQRLLSFLQIYIKTKVLNSPVLVLDEPLNHLDYSRKFAVNKLLQDLIDERKEKGDPLTLIIVSHCLPFTFIKEHDETTQYVMQSTTTHNLVKREKKIAHCDCINDDFICDIGGDAD